MVEHLSPRIGSIAALTAAIASIFVLAVLSPPAAHAERYCWGAYLPKLEATCTGHERYGSVVSGMGGQHSVCVALEPYGPIKCSSGPGAWVSTNYGTNYWGVGWIQDNAPGGTYAYGEIF